MSDEAMLQRLEAIVHCAQEPLVCRYMKEALNCFSAEAHNGAVIMTWNAAICYIRKLVEDIGIDLFIHDINNKDNQPLELSRINDSKFLHACKHTGLLQEAIVRLDRLRNRRNDCAHPSGFFISADETVNLIESISDVICHKISDERLKEIGIVKEYIKKVDIQEGERIASWLHEDLYPQLAYDLLTMFISNDDIKNVSGIIGLWHKLWSRLDDAQQRRLWNRLEQSVQAVLEDETGNTLRTPEQFAQLICWPSTDDEHKVRDRIGILYIEWFKKIVQEDTVRSADLELARQLRQYLPVPLRESLQSILQEMIRRYIE